MKQEVITAIESGEAPPTVKEVIAKRAGGARAGTKFANRVGLPAPEERDPDTEAVEMLRRPLLQRLNHKNPYVKLGLYPFGGPPNLFVLQALDYYSEKQFDEEEITESQYHAILDAIKEINKEIPKGGTI